MADHNGPAPPEDSHRRDRYRDEDRPRGDRDRERERSSRDRDRERGDRDRERRRSRSRDRRRSRSRERRRSRSRDRGRDERRRKSRSKSRSNSRSKSPMPVRRRPRAPTQWDVLPAGGIAAMAPPTVPANLIPPVPDARLTAAVGVVGVVDIAGQTHSQQATRHARRIYVGGLPPTAGEQSIATFFSHALAAVGGNTAGPGNAVVNVYINKERQFAFVELRTVEETSNAMALDGIMFEGVAVRVRRPNDYNPAAAALLGPSTPNPGLNLAAIGLTKEGGGGGGGGIDQTNRIFVGGLPYYLTEEQCRELLGSFGAIKTFDLIKNPDTGLSKGYGFVVYEDPSVTDVACQGLNGLQMGDRTLTVRRAEQGAKGGSDHATATNMVPLGAPTATLAPPSRILVLTNAVTAEELQDNTEYQEIMEDMKEECSKHGQILDLLIPRTTPSNPNPPGVNKVIIEYADAASAGKAHDNLHGRKFGGNVVTAVYLSEANYAAGKYDEVQAW